MAYIEKERVAEIRKELRALFPEYKISVTRQNCSCVNVKILAGPIDFFDDSARADGHDYLGQDRKLSQWDKEHRHVQVNEFWIKDSWAGEAREFLLQVKNIVCKGNVNRNAGDLGADYPDWNFFTCISIGSWDKPYELKETLRKAAA